MGKNLRKYKMLGQIIKKTLKNTLLWSPLKNNYTKLEFLTANKQLHRRTLYRFPLLIYGIKIVTNIFIGFKIWCQVGGGGETFLIYRR